MPDNLVLSTKQDHDLSGACWGSKDPDAAASPRTPVTIEDLWAARARDGN